MATINYWNIIVGIQGELFDSRGLYRSKTCPPVGVFLLNRSKTSWDGGWTHLFSMLPLQTLAGWLQSWYWWVGVDFQYPFKWRTREWNLMISDGFTFDILVMTSWGGDGKRRGQFTDRSSNISINDANLRGYGFILRNWYYVGAYLGKVKWLWLSDGWTPK